MEQGPRKLQYYAESLYGVQNFDEAFKAFEQAVIDLGFGGVLYTFIPQVLIQSNFSQRPVYEVSDSYAPSYLQHYTEARFDKYDPLIKAVSEGEKEPIIWWEDTCRHYMRNDTRSKEVIASSRQYGIRNGLTLPLMSGPRGIAGASFISDEGPRFKQQLKSGVRLLKIYTSMFHTMVQSNACYSGRFVKPVLASLSATERLFLAGLSMGKSPAQIAIELGKSEGYLEQVMLRIRRKMSGVGNDEMPLVNRNQVMYYFGLMNFLEAGEVKGLDPY